MQASRLLRVRSFELKDHLGNVRVLVSDQKDANAAAQVQSYYNYYAFGMEMPNRTFDADKGYRYGFNGKEKENELNQQNYDFGARIYDSRIGKWLSRDPMEHKYPSNSTYNAFVNDPINVIDPDGGDIIILRNTSGAAGFGHQAILVGSDATGWTYVSKDSYQGKLGVIDSPPIFTIKTFNSLEEFKNSPHNFVLANGIHSKKGTETGEDNFEFELDDKGNKIQRYDQAFYIGTNRPNGTSTDKQTIAAASAAAKTDYCVADGDCSDVVGEAVKASKNYKGADISNGEAKIKTWIGVGYIIQKLVNKTEEKSPNDKFDRIVERNPDGFRRDDLTKPSSLSPSGTEKGYMTNINNSRKEAKDNRSKAVRNITAGSYKSLMPPPNR